MTSDTFDESVEDHYLLKCAANLEPVINKLANEGTVEVVTLTLEWEVPLNLDYQQIFVKLNTSEYQLSHLLELAVNRAKISLSDGKRFALQLSIFKAFVLRILERHKANGMLSTGELYDLVKEANFDYKAPEFELRVALEDISRYLGYNEAVESGFAEFLEKVIEQTGHSTLLCLTYSATTNSKRNDSTEQKNFRLWLAAKLFSAPQIIEGLPVIFGLAAECNLINKEAPELLITLAKQCRFEHLRRVISINRDKNIICIMLDCIQKGNSLQNNWQNETLDKLIELYSLPLNKFDTIVKAREILEKMERNIIHS